jgi:hypothetical protein
VPVALVRGRAVVQQPDGARAGRHSPMGLPQHRNVMRWALIARIGIHASSWCRRANSSSRWRLASTSSSSRARRWASVPWWCEPAPWWHRAGSGSELLDVVAT